MDLAFLNQTEYILEAWTKYAADDPAALALTDERHPRGLSRRQVDELSGRVYAWLKGKNIGREDFVFLCLPRGAVPLIAVLGVWKAGAAFTMVEDNYPPERIAYIRKKMPDIEKLEELDGVAPKGDHHPAQGLEPRMGQAVQRQRQAQPQDPVP